MSNTAPDASEYSLAVVKFEVQLITLNPPPTSPSTFSTGTGVFSKNTEQAAKEKKF